MSNAHTTASTTLPDLSACDREPIHIPGLIEPSGALLVAQSSDLRVVQASANTGSVLGIPVNTLIGTTLTQVLDEPSGAKLHSHVFTKQVEGKRRYLGDVRLRSGPVTFYATVHQQSPLLLLELEVAGNHEHRVTEGELHSTLTEAMGDLDDQLSLTELCQRVTTHIRALTGFDRVMVYRFMEDDSGSVIAEDRRSDIAPYLGLRYPASDIPAQARRLYLINTLRLKADVEAPAVPMVPELNPVTKQALDMSHCVLRAMSPIHNEYLRNMGVRASMSISIVKDDRLWGLIACHHTQSCHIRQDIRISCEVLARVFAAHIASAEQHDVQQAVGNIRAYVEQLREKLQQSANVATTLKEEGDRLYKVIDATGVAICLGEEIALRGATPGLPFVQNLVGWLRTNQQDYLLRTDKLRQLYPEAESVANSASGLISARIGQGGTDFVLWFRPAAVDVVQWAGNPDKPVQETEVGKRISPRRSFEAWKQTVTDRSAPWADYERDFAAAIRQTLAERLLVERNDDVMRLNLELERSNIELDSFAYAASHDLQEPVRTIKAFAQLLTRRAGRKLEKDELDLIGVIENGADRMGNLISALLTYGQVGGGKRRERKMVNLEDVLRWVLLNLDETIRDSGATVTHDVLPTVTADPDQMIQLLQNLVGNAIKYRKPEEPPQVHVTVDTVDRSWRVVVRDNGQGFDPSAREMIFGAFKRLHGREIPGTGIGLALCKRIVEHHGGRIWAESEGKGHGATLTFTLPQ